jgi:hypothetical protein
MDVHIPGIMRPREGRGGGKRAHRVRTSSLHTGVRDAKSKVHTHQWLGTFGNPGNGQYREELCRAVAAIQGYLAAHELPPARALLRLDGQYGTRAVLSDLADLAHVIRGQDYHLLAQAEVQTRLHLPPDQQLTHPESRIARMLYDCPDVPVGTEDKRFRVVVATHPASPQKSRVGSSREGIVYELFLTNLPQHAFTAADVVTLYLHRGAFENALSDEDQEQDPDRWCSQATWGQECWQIVSQWVWNVRLELGHHLSPEPVRTTEFAVALPASPTLMGLAPAQGYAPVAVGQSWKRGRFSGRDFTLQPDGTLRCPAGQTLVAHERRREADGSLRVVCGASMRSCRPCPLRDQCQWQGRATAKPRQVSVLLHPLLVASAPILWRDWSRRRQRRAGLRLLRDQRVEVQVGVGRVLQPLAEAPPLLSRTERAHWRLSWAERLARNARARAADPVTIRLFGVPAAFATSLGLATE